VGSDIEDEREKAWRFFVVSIFH